ncbi:hypothetical protein [Streptomyces syringium]|uniref:hypothetical protein n=1 Tax=Streptomyces syringium TaxID=76729 RepID=UPI003AAC01C3
MTTAPWDRPSTRKKPLKLRRAETLARQAEATGERLKQAREKGPEAVLAVSFDRLRATLKNLPDDQRADACERVVRLLDQARLNLSDA